MQRAAARIPSTARTVFVRGHSALFAFNSVSKILSKTGLQQKVDLEFQIIVAISHNC